MSLLLTPSGHTRHRTRVVGVLTVHRDVARANQRVQTTGASLSRSTKPSRLYTSYAVTCRWIRSPIFFRIRPLSAEFANQGAGHAASTPLRNYNEFRDVEDCAIVGECGCEQTAQDIGFHLRHQASPGFLLECPIRKTLRVVSRSVAVIRRLCARGIQCSRAFIDIAGEQGANFEGILHGS